MSSPVLDWIPETRFFALTVPHGHLLDPSTVMEEYGLDLSASASSSRQSVLITQVPYAAAAFAEFATPRARGELDWIIREIASSWALDADRHFEIPADEELRPFQKGSIAYALDRKHALIADEPGLGKTVQAITIANEIQAKRKLVICPAQIRLQWARQVQRWTTQKRQGIYLITSSKNGVHPTAEWTVASYEMATSPGVLRALSKGSYDMLVLDEAHRLKNSETQRTHAVFGYQDGKVRLGRPHGQQRAKIWNQGDEELNALAMSAEKIVALTGTPLPNRPRECYTLARHLAWDSIDWMSEDRFRDRFNPSEVKTGTRTNAEGEEETYTWNDERSGRHAELQARLRSHFMVRHLKKDVLTHLKPPVYDLVYVDADTPAIRAALAAEKLLDIDPETLDGRGFSLGGDIPISTARRLMGEAMAPWCVEYVDMLLSDGEPKVCVFAHHHSVMNHVQERLGKYGLLRIDGSTSGPRKQKLVDLFIREKGNRVLLGELVSLGTGTDGLQEVCGRAVIIEPDWVPGNNIQAFDRLHRDGQTRTVLGDIVVVKDSLAEKILVNALRKLRVQHAALDRKVLT